jgi:hypothetical protein
MKSRKTLVKTVKLTDPALKGFVLEVVNATDRQVDGSDDSLPRRYRRFFPTRERDIQLMAQMFRRVRDPNDPFLRKEIGEVLCRAVIGELRDWLRAIWSAEYDDVAEWRLFQLRLKVHTRTNVEDKKSRRLYPPLPDTPIEQAIDWVRRNLFMLRVCRNPECSRPFFVASRAQRRFCTECVPISQKALKRQWWRENRGRQQDKQETALRVAELPTTDALPVSTLRIGPVSVTEGAQTCVNIKAGARIVRTKRSGSRTEEAESRLKQFLDDIVNEPGASFDYILKKYADAGFLPSKTISERAVALNPEFLTPEELRARRRQEMHQAVEKLRDGLRSIWSADDQYTAQWRLFSLRNEIYGSADSEKYGSGDELQPPPPDRLVHRACDYLRRNLSMLRTCKNPACETPLFIADKGSQTFCSEVCARWGQERAKTRWWKKEGPAWRKRRRLQQKKSRKPLRKSR